MVDYIRGGVILHRRLEEAKKDVKKTRENPRHDLKMVGKQVRFVSVFIHTSVSLCVCVCFSACIRAAFIQHGPITTHSFRVSHHLSVEFSLQSVLTIFSMHVFE